MAEQASNNEPRTKEIARDLFRHEAARLVSMLVARFGTRHLQLAEDVVQESLVRALQTWPYRGIPANPAAWLTQTARNLALDHLRRLQNWNQKEEGIAREAARWLSQTESSDAYTDKLGDDCLRMLFVCFHPQLSTEAQTALALRTLCGLSAAEIASAFFTSEAAVSKRLVRARQRIQELALPFVVPSAEELEPRLDGVLSTLHLLFNEGYKASSGEHLVREELCHEALRLALHLTAHPATAQPRTHALIALMLLNAARLPSRTDQAGNLLRLHEQDRRSWNQAMIQQGLHYLGLASQGKSLSEYHLQAGIAACHCVAQDEHATDWPRILALYTLLKTLNDSPIIALNRTVAVDRVRGPQAALEELEVIQNRQVLEQYHLFHAVRGDLLQKLGRAPEAAEAFLQAETLATHPVERAFIQKRRLQSA